jgi:hypothetical protein
VTEIVIRGGRRIWRRTNQVFLPIDPASTPETRSIERFHQIREFVPLTKPALRVELSDERLRGDPVVEYQALAPSLTRTRFRNSDELTADASASHRSLDDQIGNVAFGPFQHRERNPMKN